jgi:hypothetical protein
MRKKRDIKSINVFLNDNPNVTVEDIENIPNLKSLIYLEAFRAIKDGINTEKEIVDLFDINHNNIVLTLEKKDWPITLNQIIKHLEKQEKYEACAEVKSLIKQINEPRSKQDNPGRKQRVRNKNTNKKKAPKIRTPK